MRHALIAVLVILAAGCAHKPNVVQESKPARPVPRNQVEPRVEYFPEATAGAAKEAAGWQHALVPAKKGETKHQDR